eukprot:40297-Eustigmatos_ZCMA.PRE.1
MGKDTGIQVNKQTNGHAETSMDRGFEVRFWQADDTGMRKACHGWRDSQQGNGGTCDGQTQKRTDKATTDRHAKGHNRSRQ